MKASVAPGQAGASPSLGRPRANGNITSRPRRTQPRLLAAMDHRDPYQRKASMRVIRLSDSSTELWFTSHSGAPTSLSK